MLPEALNVPLTLAPVPVITNIFALPATYVLTLPFAVTITLLLPLTIELPADIVKLLNKPPSPWKKLALAKLPKLALPLVILPVTVRELNVPTLVMFGCAAVINVPVR